MNLSWKVNGSLFPDLGRRGVLTSGSDESRNSSLIHRAGCVVAVVMAF